LTFNKADNTFVLFLNTCHHKITGQYYKHANSQELKIVKRE
jgi:hypothetical protein